MKELIGKVLRALLELIEGPRRPSGTALVRIDGEDVFEIALRTALEREGVDFTANGAPISGRTGYTNDPDDPGGETNYGITAETARAHGYLGEMKDLPYEVVRRVYRAGYWDRIKGDDVPDPDVAIELFDTAVNCGVAVAVRFLQETLNVLNNEGTRYGDIDEDGRMGGQTLEALARALRWATWYKPVILCCQNSWQVVHYRDLCRKRPRLEKFFPGWVLNRGMRVTVARRGT